MSDIIKIIKLSREERDILQEAILYYRDEATREDGEGVGLKRDSKEFKLLCSIVGKIQEVNYRK